MKAEKIIVFDAQEPSIVCALSYFLDQGYELIGAPLNNIEALWDNPNVWLLNVKPNISGGKKDFDFFLGFHPDKNISLQDLIDFDESRHLSKEAINFLAPWWKQHNLMTLAREISDPSSWKYSRRAARYGQALSVSRTLNAKKFHEKLVMEAVKEINNQKKNFELDYLAENYPAIARATESALQKIMVQESDFSIPNREVAYGYLDNLSSMVDLYTVRKEALKRFPYLVVIQFRENGQEFTWFGSRKLNVKQMFLLDEGGANEALIKGKFKKINTDFRRVISEIT